MFGLQEELKFVLQMKQCMQLCMQDYINTNQIMHLSLIRKYRLPKSLRDQIVSFIESTTAFNDDNLLLLTRYLKTREKQVIKEMTGWKFANQSQILTTYNNIIESA